MKRTDRLTILVALLLFLAFAAYAGTYAYRALSDHTITADAVTTSVTVSGIASGIVIRDEVALSSDEPYIDVSAADGAKVPVGGVIALSMSSEAGLARASRIHELEGEISRVSAALSGADSADNITSLDQSLRRAVLGLSKTVARHESGSLDTAVIDLSSLLLDGGTQVSQQELSALQNELNSLKSSSSSDTKQLVAGKSGVFSSVVDGYEALSSAELDNLTPDGVLELIDARQEVPSGTFGKLVTGYRWYFAAVMTETDAAHISVGSYASLDFGKYYGSAVTALVQSISAPEDGNVAVVFRCASALAETLSMREATASVLFDEYDGVRVPLQAVNTDEDGQTYVWVITAMQLERKDIDILYRGDDFCIARRQSAANSLREGNTVVVSGTDLYEGKLME